MLLAHLVRQQLHCVVEGRGQGGSDLRPMRCQQAVQRRQQRRRPIVAIRGCLCARGRFALFRPCMRLCPITATLNGAVTALLEQFAANRSGKPWPELPKDACRSLLG